MEEQIILALNITWDVIKNWWWVFLPFVLWRRFLFWWLWWRQEIWMFRQKNVVLEIKMPKEVLKPLRSMEQVFSAIWGNVFDPPDWWEKWFEGKMLLRYALEIVSLGGESHFYLRVHESRRNAVEASIYSQYPDAEITVVDDYTKNVPQNLPNKDWDMWGTDYEMMKEDVYPLKTYTKFFEEKPSPPKEEKRVDPMSTLLEGMAKLGPGEQLWVQIIAKPVRSLKQDFYDFIAKGREVADIEAKRPLKEKAKPIIQEAVKELITGKPLEVEEKIEAPLIPPEMKMTPGEREKVVGIEAKVAKRGFECFIRFIYLAKRDVYFGGAKAIPFGFFQQFATEDMNQPKPASKTITKIHRKPILDLIRARRVHLRKRRLFFRYIKRWPPLFPKKGLTFLLNIEELATIFHLPGRTVAPAPFVPRVEAKRGEAPPGLPYE